MTQLRVARSAWTAVCLLALVCHAGCGPAEVDEHTPFDPLTSPEEVAGALGHAETDGPDAVARRYPDPPALAAVRSDTVIGRTGPGGQPFEVVVREPGGAGQDRRIGLRTFSIALRSEQPVAAPCSSCHLPDQGGLRPEGTRNAHRNTLPRHPDLSGAQCTTCHAAGNVELLALADGTRVPLAHAYALCGQCHYSQADDWAAGVHGKRLDGWRGRRVVLGCADCHDPHAPTVPPRIPFPGPTLPNAGLRAPDVH